MLKLIKHEFFVQNKIHNLSKYFLIFFLFSLTSITIINPYEKITSFGSILSIALIPLALIGTSSNFLKSEIEDGSFELLLTSFVPLKIVVAKYVALFLCTTISFLANLPIAYLLFNIEPYNLILMAACGFLLSSAACAVILLIAAVQCYFRNNTNFLSGLLLPLIIPSIVLSGIALQDGSSYSIIFILLGINLILIPIIIYLTSYLIANIYNI